MVHHQEDLDYLLVEVDGYNVPNNENRYKMYHRFIYVKHRQMGTNNRRKLCDYGQGFILENFPVEEGQTKCGYESIMPLTVNGDA